MVDLDILSGAWTRERESIAYTVACPVETCGAAIAEPCNYLTWIDSDSPTGYTHAVHNARYARAKALLENRTNHDPGDEDRS